MGNFDVNDKYGRDKERYVPKKYCDVQTVECFSLAITHFKAVLMTTLLKKTKKSF